MNVYECVFLFFIFFGRQQWRENNFWEKSPVNSADTLWVKTKISSKSFYLAPFLDKCFYAFYTEIQDGHQNWRENNF